MKKLVVMMSALLMMSAVPAQMSAARSNDNQTEQGQKGNRQKMDPSKMAENRVKRMAKTYNLTAEQQTKLTALFKEEMQNHKGKPGKDQKADCKDKADMKATMKANREKMDTKIKAILTSEQYAQYTKDEKARMEKRAASKGKKECSEAPQD